MPGTLLVPLDGSELAEAALPWASCLARAHDLTLLVARVVPPPRYIATGGMDGYVPAEVYEEIIEDERRAANDYVEGVRQRLLTEGLRIETAVRYGTPAENILDLADEAGAYAIAMATRGRGGLKRLVLGSVAERILKQATLPVLLVPAHAAQPIPSVTLRRLPVPLDGSPLAERALDVARELAGEGATLTLVHVVGPIERVVQSGEGSLTVVDQEATARLGKSSRPHRAGSLAARERGRRGDPPSPAADLPDQRPDERVEAENQRPKAC